MASESACVRLGSCEVCGESSAKYRCPECEVKTCCLDCVNIHKKELNCSGIRNRVKYVPMSNFSQLDFHSDYALLEETARVLETAAKGSHNMRFTKCSLVLNSLKEAAKRRKVRLELMPMKFERRKTNTTYLDWQTGHLYWKVIWTFPHANNLQLVDHRLLDTTTMENALSKYLDVDECKDDGVSERLRFYQSKWSDELTVLLKAEHQAGQNYYEVLMYETIREALEGKTIIEHPTFLIVYTDHKHEYQIISSDDEDDGSDSENRKEGKKSGSYFFNGDDNQTTPMEQESSE